MMRLPVNNLQQAECLKLILEASWKARITESRFCRLDNDSALQGLLYRATVRDLGESRPLLVTERTFKLEPPLDSTDVDFFRRAILAILLVRACGAEMNHSAFQRPSFSICVNTERHDRARAKRREKKLVGSWTALASTHFDRLVGNHVVRRGADIGVKA